ncbi:MAG: glycosyltransferase [Thermoleophilia bacterium]|nr:glycosyltransferase [Thermoleophilia bacterium]
MTTDPGAPTSRFRSATTQTPSTPEEQLRALLDDGERLYARYEELVAAAAAAGDIDGILRYAAVAGEARDPQRAYAAQRLAASILVSSVSTLPEDGTWAWATPLDRAVELLVPVLEANPHEPELLDLLGLAVYELGHTSLARRLFDAVREIDPTHERARAHLRACKQRLRAPQQVAPVEEPHTPALTRLRPHVKTIAERARRLEDRTISVCMIVKDEEELLPGCLAAVAEHVDQLVIVDTGSTDRTREIAESFGATVVDFAWTGSFSDARNESLRHATGDWILWLDADEYLVEGDGPQLRDLARRTWVEGFHVVETHFIGGADHGNQATHAPMRMFRRRPEYTWHGTVHEQVTWALPTWLPGRLQHTSVRVDHYGYLAAVVDDRGKHERNLELLMAQLAERRTAFGCFNVGTEHAAMGDWGEARRWFEEALELARPEPRWHEQQFAPLMVQRAAAARRSTGDVPGAIELVEEGLSFWPEYTDLVYERASAHASIEEWAEAAAQASRALELGDAPARFVAVSGKGSFQARMLLAQAHRRMGDVPAARAQLEQAVAEAPRFLAAIVELADLLLRTGEPAEEVSTAIDLLLGERAGSTATSLLVGSVFHEAGALEQADARYERALVATPAHGATLAAHAELRLLQGRLRDAWQLGTSCDPQDPMAGAGARSAFLAAAALHDASLLTEPARRIATAAGISTAERAMYEAWARLLAPEDAAVHSFIPQDERAIGSLFANLEALVKLEATDAFERAFPLAVQLVPDERARRLRFADLYLRMRFADMAGEELIMCAERFGPDAAILFGLGKVATIKELWDDAEIFFAESLQLDPTQREARRLLAAVRERIAG